VVLVGVVVRRVVLTFPLDTSIEPTSPSSSEMQATLILQSRFPFHRRSLLRIPFLFLLEKLFRRRQVPTSKILNVDADPLDPFWPSMAWIVALDRRLISPSPRPPGCSMGFMKLGAIDELSRRGTLTALERPPHFPEAPHTLPIPSDPAQQMQFRWFLSFLRVDLSSKMFMSF